MIGRLLERFGGRYRRLDEGDIERAIEIVLAETDPRLRLVRGHRRALRKPVIRSLAYLGGLVTRIPGPFGVSRRAFGADPQVNALFGSANDIGDLFGRSDTVREFFRQHPDSERVCLPLAMYRSERKVLGMALAGDTVRRDVAQTAVSHSGHWLGICAADEAELRAMLVWRGIHNLALVALENISRRKAETEGLREQRALLRVKLDHLQAQHRGLEAPEQAETGQARDLQDTDRLLEQTERRLADSAASSGTLADTLRLVCRVFDHPSSHLRVKTNSVRVDRMGIKRDGAEAGRGAEVQSATIHISGKPPFEVVLASFPRSELGAKPVPGYR